jgi:hypothetical protein
MCAECILQRDNERVSVKQQETCQGLSLSLMLLALIWQLWLLGVFPFMQLVPIVAVATLQLYLGHMCRSTALLLLERLSTSCCW